TYNLENGKVVETRLNPVDIFRDTLKRNRVEEKFSMPGIKEGCIIEYSYIKTSLHYWNLPIWSFQHWNYPCLYNKFETAIPNMLGYLTIRRGQDSFTVDKIEKTKQRYVMASVDVTAEVTKHTWVMKDIPAFKAEPFLVHPYNYLDAIEFDLLQTYNGDHVSGNVNWSATTKELLESEDFGVPILREVSTNLDNQVERISGNDGDYTVAAKHIYTYIRENFTCTPDDDINLGDNLYSINKKKRGSVEDLNLLLVAMLRHKNINASPVILSTTEFGTNPSKYPVIYKMNYVICMMKMAGDTTYLDASHPMLGFGKLPIECYNGHARIISDHDSGSVFFSKDDIKEQKSTTVFLSNDEKTKGLMSGTVETTPGYFESYDIRTEIKKDGDKKFFKAIRDSYSPDLTITNPGIDSLAKYDDPVKIHYDLSFKSEGQDIIYFNPILQSSFRQTPLSAVTRKYPVEMPEPVDEIYFFNMEIPEGFTVDELPKSVKVAYNGNEGFFEYLIQKSGTNIQLRSHIKLNKASFLAEDYNTLRDFFAYIVKKHSEQIVFKKKK
ncbi:MAG TPA: transglutaminase-like domain-containing protein, partial [Puia sp.]|nr:transglutaminase-like domain-containing protein [Puia sp.]